LNEHVGREPTATELASVANFARLSRAFILNGLFRKFDTSGPLCLAALIRSVGTAGPHKA